MSYLHNLATRVRQGDSIAPPVSWLLSSATVVTRAGMALRKLRGNERLDAKVVSVGNITAGGTGKTPYVIYCAQQALDAGNRVAIVTRGYGAQPAPFPIASSTIDPKDRVAMLGDEAALMLHKLSDVIVVRDPDRVRGGRKAIAEFGSDLLILDDGFQAVQIARDEDIVLIDATNPFGNGALVPRGILREPLDALGRATRIVLTRCDLAQDMPAIENEIRQIAPDVAVEHTVHAPTSLIRLHDAEILPLSTLEGQDVVAACGLGNPEAFVATLESVGARVAQRRFVPDHGIVDISGISSSDFVVVTEKDAVKLESPTPNVYALEIAIRSWEGPGA